MVWCTISLCSEIHFAARDGDLNKVSMILNNQPDLVTAKDESGETPLHWVAIGGNKDIATLLLEKKADANATDNAGFTPLHWAILFGNKAISKVLLEHDAHFDTKTKKGITPLHCAAGVGDKVLLEELLAKKADVNAITINGESPLHWAVIEGNKAEIELLLNNQADVNAKDNTGKTAMHWAGLTGQKEIAKLLKSNNNYREAKDNAGHKPKMENYTMKQGTLRAFIAEGWGVIRVGMTIDEVAKFIPFNPWLINNIKSSGVFADLLSKSDVKSSSVATINYNDSVYKFDHSVLVSFEIK